MSPGSRNKLSGSEPVTPYGRRERLEQRARTIQAIRRFFMDRGYLEVETPLLTAAPAVEAHIDAVRVGDRYLQTSPELYMKRMLSEGYQKLFQITKCFRDGERGAAHLPEFTMLEWYRCSIGYWELMDECEEMIQWVCCPPGNKVLRYQGKSINLEPPWPRLPVRDAFRRFAPLTMEEALGSGGFEEAMVHHIEPRLGAPKPTFLYDYPASMGALARLKPRDPRLAERFELYIGGMELANGFTELTDRREQHARFQREALEREQSGKSVSPMPEAFLNALDHLPECAGLALGVDRLVMLLTDCSRIDQVVAFTPEQS